MQIQFRKLQPKESNSYREIRLECLKNFPENFGSNYQDEKAKDVLFFQPHIEKQNTNNFIIGAFNNNNLVGISGFNRYESEKTKHRGRIIQVYVKLEYQGQHIGSNIIKATIEEAFKISGIEQIEINVLTNNVNAEKLYNKLGFEAYGVQENYIKIDNKYYDQKMMLLYKTVYHSKYN
ncbi:GNAT family N-acetyltransferase [Xanthomarina spongicola]|uniref:RimJ/RimL family protein N-acetyltransferase n=1 Tax=Xanthomarina spongicola TaxID=570520 RepID=A0A316DJB1_9FLAO|nr:GNAT family protein [Xanthomarina spongicola]PWK17716.1 RimJ/RimL family protein N-acetyltransferase [Xanthomarina spongicola]